MSDYKMTIEQISQYKAEINRKLANVGFPSTIGFTCKRGVGYSIYLERDSDHGEDY